MTACGSDNSQDSTPTGTTTATSAAAAATSAAAAPAPTAEELQATLNGFVDPAKPTAEKEKLVVGGDKRAANIDTMTKGLANYGTITFTVADIKTEGDQATGQVTITSPHGPAGPMPMTWQHSAAGWQLSDASACQILAMGMAPCQP
ncbi:nuclear transport factor 2 family protein [Nocardia elegans]|uniref:Nuclear transport factor 2 family protein n=1 Tax=Nocardia elegans TaxID=300029 RepID=A0ABW6TF48_9NOCA|nr:nuclear transport factor 2 family protein [Nocardia elegans]MBF6245480.1 nuclear transport factor 2 family protein [Nocardia elegans]MBF6447519.1 nuclear transport factor 2 family protein [Nocardia elegans]